MKTAILSVTERGALLGQRLKSLLVQQELQTVECYEKKGKTSQLEAHTFQKVSDIMENIFRTYDRVLCIMATGIVVRTIAPYIQHKSKDPAVMVMDEKGTFAISLLSGHLGGANEWTAEVAALVGATPVITTATDVNGLVAPDVLARRFQWQVLNFVGIRHVNAALVAGKNITYYIDKELPQATAYATELEALALPVIMADMTDEASSTIWQSDEPKVLISARHVPYHEATLRLVPKILALGMGCRRGTAKEHLARIIEQALAQVGYEKAAICGLASVNVKADEAGLLEVAEELGVPITFYTPEEMQPIIDKYKLKESQFVKKTIGVGNVCETTALLLSQNKEVLLHKTAEQGTTIAIALVPFM